MIETFIKELWRIANQYRGRNNFEDILMPILGLLYLKKTSSLEEFLSDFPRGNTLGNYPLSLMEKEIEFLNPLFEFSKVNQENNSFVFDIASTIHGYIIRSEEFGTVADGLIENFAKNGRAALHSTPKEVVGLMLHFLPKKDYNQVYNPFGGTASFTVNDLSNSEYIIDEINSSIAALGKLRLLLHNSLHNHHFYINDSISDWNIGNHRFDAVISMPPFGLKLPRNIHVHNSFPYGNNLEAYIIQNSLESINDNGKCVLAVPTSFLVGGGKLGEFRKYLVESNYIETIISLPEKLLSYTSIAFNIIVLNNHGAQRKGIRFIDATDFVEQDNKSQRKLDFNQLIKGLDNKGLHRYDRFVEFDRFIEQNEIEEKAYNLNVGKYFVDIALNEVDRSLLIPLKKVLNPIKTSRHSISEFNRTEGKMIGIKELSDNFIQTKRDFNEIEETSLRSNLRELNQKALLIASIGNRFKPTYFNGKSTIFINSNVYAYQPKHEVIDLDYLIIELRKKYVIKQFNIETKGIAVSRITQTAFKELLIALPSLEIQREQVSLFKNALIKEERKKFNALQSDIGLEIADADSYLTHQIAGPLKNVRSSFNAISELLEELSRQCKDQLFDKKVNQKSRLTFKNHMDIVKRDVSSITELVINSKKMDLRKDYVLEEFDIIRFLRGYSSEIKERESENDIDVQFDIDNDLINVKYRAINIMGDKKQLRTAMDNLIENAINHGFKNYHDNKEIEIVLYIQDKDKSIYIDVSNTGNPFPSNFTIEDYIRKGSKAGKTGGTGFGGFYVNEIVRRHQGELMFAHDKDAQLNELVTTISIELPVENFDYDE